ncbi:MAG: DUF1320 domain-containing protein [Desulfobulbaceae bacterium]|nr:DUF1320 domain-containing protein [Desulfobulbaceae bacterium]
MYATQQDIVDRYGEDELYVVFDRDGDGVLDANAIDQALSDATEEINGYLAGRYSIPLATVPGNLKTLCIDIALYKGSSSTALTEEKRQRYEDAVKYLTKVAEGKVSLGIEKQEAGGSSGASFVGNGRLFSRDSLKGM